MKPALQVSATSLYMLRMPFLLLRLDDTIITSLFPDIVRHSTIQVAVLVVLVLAPSIIIIVSLCRCIQRERSTREDYIYQQLHSFSERNKQKMLSHIELAAMRCKMHQGLLAENKRLENQLYEHKEEVEQLR